MKIDSTLLEMENLTKEANGVKAMTIERLLRDGIITQEKADEYREDWQIIVIKQGWFKRWLNKYLPNGNPNEYIFKIVNFKD